jgi:hypothetical protein
VLYIANTVLAAPSLSRLISPLEQSLQSLTNRLKSVETDDKSFRRVKWHINDRLALSRIQDDVRTTMVNLNLVATKSSLETIQLTLQNVELGRALSTRNVALSRRTSCDWDCACVCHRLRTLRSPEPLAKVVGALRVVIVVVRCHGTSASTVSLVYRFPSWLVPRTLHLQFLHSRSGNFSVRLGVSRVLPSNAFAFSCAATGDIEVLKLLLVRGVVSPFDVDPNGDTLLHVGRVNARGIVRC